MTYTSSAGLVTITREGDGGHVALLTLNRPEVMNAVSLDLAKALAACTDWLAQQTDVRAVVLASSNAKAFCVGADLKERNGSTDADLMAQRPHTRAAYHGVLRLPMPVIAAVDGYALGGGFELALACDLIVAAEQAVMGLPEVAVGVIPGGGGTQLLTRRVGWGRAASLVLTARRIDAGRALELGVVDEVVATGTAQARALEIAAEIAKNSPVGVRNAKKAMTLGSGMSLADALEIEDGCWRATAFSADRAEGVAAFNEKRDPVWPA